MELVTRGPVAFSLKEWNFALGAVRVGVDGKARTMKVWESMLKSGVLPNEVTMALLARGLCRTADDVASTLSVLREGRVRGQGHILINLCIDAAARWDIMQQR